MNHSHMTVVPLVPQSPETMLIKGKILKVYVPMYINESPVLPEHRFFKIFQDYEAYMSIWKCTSVKPILLYTDVHEYVCLQR